jgi:spermidine synthase
LGVVLCLTALCHAFLSHRPRPLLVSAGVVALLTLACQTGGEHWRQVMTSGVFRARSSKGDDRILELRRGHLRVVHYEDSPEGTVSVERGDGVRLPAGNALRVNGYPETVDGVDWAARSMLGHIPLLLRGGRSVLVSGFGSGVTAAAVAAHGVEHLVVAEPREAVLRCTQHFAHWNRGVLSQARTRTLTEDGRTLLKLSPQEYDVILSDPPPIGSLGGPRWFSRGFYELAARRLRPGGQLAQLYAIDEAHDAVLSMVLRTLCGVFPHVEIWDAGAEHIILVASASAWPDSLEHLGRGLERSRVRTELARMGLNTPAQILARQLASAQTASAIPGPGPTVLDEYPILELEAPRAHWLGATSGALAQFDERTWQAPLAPAAKQAALSLMTDEALRGVFVPYSTMNAELAEFLKMRFRAADGLGSLDYFGDPMVIPCIFRPPGAPRYRLPVAGLAGSAWDQLTRAEVILRSHPGHWMEAVDTIASVLGRVPSGSRSPEGHRPLAFYAAQAVRVCWREGERERAARVLALGLKQDPTSAELQYLSRLVQRRTPRTPRPASSETVRTPLL